MSETPSHFVAVCPNCLMSLKVHHAYSGSQVRCKHCEHKFRAFAPESPAPSSSSSDNVETGPLKPAESGIERMVVTCPVCSATLSVRRVYAGKYVQCKKCEQKFLVPNIIEPRVGSGRASTEPDIFDRLYQELDQAEAPQTQPEPASAPSEAGQELAAILAERDQLQETGEALRTELTRVQEELRTELAGMQAERDSALGQLDQLREQHASFESQQSQGGEEAQRLAAELASIRSDLGESSPSELIGFRAEAERLTAENERLQDELRNLRMELSAHAEQAQALPQREEELRQSQLKIERLEEQLRSQLAEDNQIFEEVRGLRDRLAAGAAEFDRLNREIEHRDQAVRAAEDRNEELSRQLRQRDDERSAARAEIERLTALHQSARDEAEQHRATFAEREQQLGRVHGERSAEIENLQGMLAETEQKHREERDRLEEQLHRVQEDSAVTATERAELQSKVQQLLDAQEALRADHERSLESHRDRISGEFHARLEAEGSRHAQHLDEIRGQLAESAQLAERLKEELEQERSHHAQQTAELQSRAAEEGQLVERLKAEILTLAQTRATPDTDLEAAQHEIAELRRQLYETETSKRSMSSLLEGMGIRLH